MNSPSDHSPSFGHTIVTGLIVTAVILCGKFVLEHFSLYQAHQLASYSWLQSQLQPPRTRASLPIVLIDINKLEPKIEEVNGKKFSVTPRSELLSLISAVAAQEPKVIGVDIDFATNEFGYPGLERDPPFFRSLLSLKKTVPIFLGIGRSHGKHPSKWLGDPEFQGLAADLVSPEDQRKMYQWVEVAGNPSAASGRGPSLSGALAEAFAEPQWEPPGLIRWALIRDHEEQIEPNIKASEFLVDFSAVQTFQDMRITTIDPKVIADFNWALKGKVVLIGDGVTSYSRDTFYLPTLSHPKPVPGIYKHASATYTLIMAPLYELTRSGRLVVDFFLSLFVLVLLALLRRFFARHTSNRLAEETAMLLLTILVSIGVFFVGVLFVHYTRTIWDDFLFVIFALFIHSPVAIGLEFINSFRKRLPTAIVETLSEPTE